LDNLWDYSTEIGKYLPVITVKVEVSEEEGTSSRDKEEEVEFFMCVGAVS
jgi:hypothetical protein